MRRTFFAFAATVGAAAWFMPSCTSNDEGCLWFDDYAPPSAKIVLIDGATNQPICMGISPSVDRGDIIPFPELCRFEIPLWYPTDAGSGILLQVNGFVDEMLTFPVEVDRCGAIKEPPAQNVVLTPVPVPDASVPEPLPDAAVSPPMDAGADAGADGGGTDGATDSGVDGS